ALDFLKAALLLCSRNRLRFIRALLMRRLFINLFDIRPRLVVESEAERIAECAQRAFQSVGDGFLDRAFMSQAKVNVIAVASAEVLANDAMNHDADARCIRDAPTVFLLLTDLARGFGDAFRIDRLVAPPIETEDAVRLGNDM